MDPCTCCDACDNLCEIVPEMARTFKALGDLTRLRLIYLLSSDSSGTLGVSELATRLGISQPAVSQHLKTLKSEGIVDSRREGFFIYYSINRERMVLFRKQFDRIYASVMDKCDKEFVWTETRQISLNACVIFYSYTGITRGVAEKIGNACGCDLVPVQTKKEYSSFSAYTTGVFRSRKGACDPIIPEEIDVSGYDLLVIGTPVWAGKPTPAINAVVQAFSGCEGKKALIFVTSCGIPGEALPLLKAALAKRGVSVIGEISLTKNEIGNPEDGNSLIEQVIAAYNACTDQPDMPEKQNENPIEDYP
ncbi:MAG: metalloregulator ArsR/SmtB family transcription factor [Methanospirillaceae archaeon]|nr:metalloregulator ArsR/SmtB family transcription factor [Methanospirillaceae archaeon]